MLVHADTADRRLGRGASLVSLSVYRACKWTTEIMLVLLRCAGLPALGVPYKLYVSASNPESIIGGVTDRLGVRIIFYFANLEG